MTLARRSLLVLAAAALAMATAGLPARTEGWYAEIETSLGSFTIKLNPEQAPQTVAHFVAFAQGRMEVLDPFTGNKRKFPFYDGLKIHKTSFARRFEAGDWTGTGHGMPPVWVPPEPGPMNFTRPYRAGMTAASLKRISGVMFFVSIVAEPYLNASHNCFGEVVEGREVVDHLCVVKVDDKGRPLEPLVIKHVAIVKSGNPAPLPEPVPYDPPVPTFAAPGTP